MSRASARLVAVVPDLGLDLHLEPGAAALVDGARAGDAVAWLRGTVGRSRRIPGRLEVDGRSLHRRSPAGRVRRGLVAVGDDPVAADVSLVDHLGAAVSLAAARARLDEVPRLRGRADDPAGVLSGGERRLLAWARATLLEPRVVVLDRAGTGLDRDAVTWAGETVAAWRRSGVTVVVRPGRTEERGWAAPDAPGPGADAG